MPVNGTPSRGRPRTFGNSRSGSFSSRRSPASPRLGRCRCGTADDRSRSWPSSSMAPTFSRPAGPNLASFIRGGSSHGGSTNWRQRPIGAMVRPSLCSPTNEMKALETMAERKLASLGAPLSLQLPGGRRLGAEGAAVALAFNEWQPLANLGAGHIGRIAEDYVEGRVDIRGPLREVIDLAVKLLERDPTASEKPSLLQQWWRDMVRGSRSLARHTPDADARQVQFHYDVSDDFYALWLDPRRVYSCAYYRDPAMTLAEAQEAKLEHICRKLDLQRGERFLDIGAGWGGLLLWAAEHHGVIAHGITLSRNQHAHVNRLIEE